MGNNKYTVGTVKERLLATVEIVTESGCWVWMASLNTDGYGQMSVDGKMRKAHTVAYELFVGPIPAGLELDHACRVRCCCNPYHVEPVTHAENMRRGISGELQRGKTHCKRGHPLSGDNLKVDRKQRRCLECSRIRCRLARAGVSALAEVRM